MRSSHLRISLNTKEASEARYLGAQLDAVAMQIFSDPSTGKMTRDQLAELFKTAHIQHKNKLGLLADSERSAPTSDRSELLALELARGEAYALLAAQGANAQLDQTGERRLREKGYDTAAIIRILEEMESLRDGNRIQLLHCEAGGPDWGNRSVGHCRQHRPGDAHLS